MTFRFKRFLTATILLFGLALVGSQPAASAVELKSASIKLAEDSFLGVPTVTVLAENYKWTKIAPETIHVVFDMEARVTAGWRIGSSPSPLLPFSTTVLRRS